MDIPRRTASLRVRYPFVEQLKKGEPAFGVNYAVKCACKTEKSVCIWRESRWSLVRFIKAVCFEHIKYSLHTEDFLAMPAIHIHLLHTEAHNQTEAKTNREHGLVNTCITCGLPERLWNQLLFSLLHLFLSSSNPPFPPQACSPQPPNLSEIAFHAFLLFLNLPDESTTPPSFWRSEVLC